MALTVTLVLLALASVVAFVAAAFVPAPAPPKVKPRPQRSADKVDDDAPPEPPAAPGVNPAKRGLRIAGSILAALTIILTIVGCVTIVPTKQVGIPVTFGAPGSPMTNGLHFKAPWTNVVLMDATIQDENNTGDAYTTAKDFDEADVYVHNLVRWSIKEDAADSLYRDYRDFDRIAESLVQPEIAGAVAEVMSTYDPLGTDKPTNDQVAEAIQTRLQQRVGDRVTINSVSVTLIDFTDATKDRINALNKERGNTRVAEQRTITAAKEAEANRILAESVSDDPNVLVSKCLDLIDAGRTFPAGFQCWPDTAGSTGVIVQQNG